MKSGKSVEKAGVESRILVFAPGSVLMTNENRILEIDAAILIKAVEIFGSKQDTELWLRSPAIGLDGQRPIDLLKSLGGKRLVEEFLFRLEYGVYP